MEVTSIYDLAHAVENRCASIIGVDGYLGAGKTTVAMQLAEQIGYACVHLDDYLDPKHGGFVENINLSALNKALRVKRPLIIEGLCLLEVLDRLQVNVDFLVYVTGIGPSSTDCDKKVFDETNGYFQTYRPAIKADVIFNMDKYKSNSSNEIDIAYIKAKTAIAIVLAVGGILSILVGALVFVLGLQSGDSALIKVAGAEVSAKGIGGVIPSYFRSLGVSSISSETTIQQETGSQRIKEE